ncbi:VPLPA-CTERM sorting domain-containing protein [Hwanghaeella sp.]|uniref:VPLPA-CTERM sorting domain-containing protein n=1 Tax=Hwanghaeella sp. TaxID=2605943 RepID=UPI003CCBCBDB
MKGLGVFGSKTLAAGLAVIGVSAMLSSGANAAVVAHTGEILDVTVGALNFSRIYRSNDGPGGGNDAREIGGDVVYSWDSGSDNSLSTGDKALFDQQDLLVYSETFGSGSSAVRYDITILNSENSFLEVGWQLPWWYQNGNSEHHSTHVVGGQLEYMIQRFVDGQESATLVDMVYFDSTIEWDLVNGAQQTDDGGIEMYLWGDTRRNWWDLPGNGGEWDFPDCDGVGCQDIISLFYTGGTEEYNTYKKKRSKKHGKKHNHDYNKKEMVWKIAFSGTVTPVPVPATMPLLISALIGLGVLARRRHATV